MPDHQEAEILPGNNERAHLAAASTNSNCSTFSDQVQKAEINRLGLPAPFVLS